MKQLQPVIWMKGTFLSPQHLQTQDRFLENNLRFQLEALSYQPWGFSELQINQEALAAGNFQITRATGIFPDGLVFDIPNSDLAPTASRWPSSSIRISRNSGFISASQITGIADSTYRCRLASSIRDIARKPRCSAMKTRG